jgi:hypothetical protein
MCRAQDVKSIAGHCDQTKPGIYCPDDWFSVDVCIPPKMFNYVFEMVIIFTSHAEMIS